jgi:hypothetical protein
MDGWMDRHDEAHKCFCKYVNMPKNVCMGCDCEWVHLVKLYFKSLAACLLSAVFTVKFEVLTEVLLMIQVF